MALSKLLDVTRLTELAWQARIGPRDEVERRYRSFLEHTGEARGMVEVGEQHQ